MEMCAGGDLLNYVRKRRKLKEDVAKYLFKQIIEAIGYIHSKSILHRDIKLDNILLDNKGSIKVGALLLRSAGWRLRREQNREEGRGDEGAVWHAGLHSAGDPKGQRLPRICG